MLRKIDYPEDNFSSGEWKRSLKLRDPQDFVHAISNVRAGPTRSALEIQAQAFHGHGYPNGQLVISREPICYIWLNRMCDNNVVTAVSLQDPGR